MPRYALWRGVPIIYASRTMSKAETNYAQLDREALSVMFGVKLVKKKKEKEKKSKKKERT